MSMFEWFSVLGGSVSGVEATFAGYSLLVILVPVMICILVILVIVGICYLASMSTKLSDMVSRLEDISMTLAANPEEMRTEKLQADSVRKDDAKASMVITLGIMLGFCGVVSSFFVSSDEYVWRGVLLAAGVTSIVVSIVVPIYEAVLEKRKTKNREE